MRYVGSIVFVLYVGPLLTPGEVYAQSDSSVQEPAPYSLREGSWALMFGVSDEFTLSSFGGTAISAKVHLSPRRAVRCAASWNYTSTDEHRTTVSVYEYEVSMQDLYYLAERKRVKLFAGAGPMVRVSGEDTNAFPTDVDSYSLGVLGAIGCEWFATGRMSLSAEYGFEASYERREERVTGSPNRVNRVTGWKIVPAPVRMGILFYF